MREGELWAVLLMIANETTSAAVAAVGAASRALFDVRLGLDEETEDDEEERQHDDDAEYEDDGGVDAVSVAFGRRADRILDGL